jgi:hypothetical protein
MCPYDEQNNEGVVMESCNLIWQMMSEFRNASEVDIVSARRVTLRHRRGLDSKYLDLVRVAVQSELHVSTSAKLLSNNCTSMF